MKSRLRALNLKGLRVDSLTQLVKELNQAGSLTILNLQAIQTKLPQTLNELACIKLTFLNISDIGLTEVTFNLPALTELICHSNRISSIEVFTKKCFNLQLIDLENN